MNLVPSQFQISQVDKKDLMIANYTSENVLLKANPGIKLYQDITDSVIDYVASASPNIYGKKSSLIKSFFKEGAVRYTDSEFLQWSLKGNGISKNISVENMMPGVKTPGINHSEILIKVKNRLWKSSDTVYPAIAPTAEFTVQGDPVGDGIGNTIYTLVYHTTDPNEYVDPSLLEADIVWMKRGSSVSEYSSEYGSSYIGGTSLITFRSTLTSWSKSHEVSDKGWSLLMKIKAKDMNGADIPQFKEMIITFTEAEFEAQSRYEHEQTMFWGQYAGKNIIDPTTGYYRRTGPGMVQWLFDGNTLPYHTGSFNVETLENLLLQYFYGRVEPSNSHTIIDCGIGLIQLVNKALTKRYNVKPIERPQSMYVKPGSSFPGSNQKGYTLTEPQFLGFDFAPYGSIEFRHMPILDNQELFGELVHPETGLPLTSYWGISKGLGKTPVPNTQLVYKKNSKFRVHVCGVWSPAGPIMDGRKNGYVAVDGRRGYTLKAGETFGVRVKDVTRTLFMFPAIEY